MGSAKPSGIGRESGPVAERPFVGYTTAEIAPEAAAMLT
jgi:hypothetical protein